MLKIDDNLISSLGLSGLSPPAKNLMLSHIYETLENRVGERLAGRMSNAQLDEFEMFFEEKDEAGAFNWLEESFPDYKDVVQKEFEDLKTEIASEAERILEADEEESPDS